MASLDMSLDSLISKGQKGNNQRGKGKGKGNKSQGGSIRRK
jgi:hypothetical protein